MSEGERERGGADACVLASLLCFAMWYHMVTTCCKIATWIFTIDNVIQVDFKPPNLVKTHLSAWPSSCYCIGPLGIDI